MPDPYIAVQENMTPEAQDAAMAHALRMNPRLQGAHLADVLEMYYENDAMLVITEPFWERRGDQLIVSVPAQYVSAALLAVGLLLKEPQQLDDTAVLLVELLARRAADYDGVHGSFGGEGRGVAAQEGSFAESNQQLIDDGVVEH